MASPAIISDSGDATPPPPTLNPLAHNVCIAVAVLAPLAMLLPPRKMDLRFLLLSGAFSLSTNQLAIDSTGQSLYSRFAARAGSLIDTSEPQGIRQTQRRIREEKEARRAREVGGGGETAPKKDGVGVVKKIWMGEEKEGWKERRLDHEIQSIEEGKGYADLMMEHIKEAFSGWGSGGKDDNGNGSGTR